MELGAFSVSLAVKDLAASRAFYEALGFEAFHGEATQGWLILRNGAATIGLFQGMFERNILDLQSRLGFRRPAPRRVHRRPRDPARAQGGRHPARDGGRRGDDRTRERGHRGPGRQPDPVRPARLTPFDHHGPARRVAGPLVPQVTHLQLLRPPSNMQAIHSRCTGMRVGRAGDRARPYSGAAVSAPSQRPHRRSIV